MKLTTRDSIKEVGVIIKRYWAVLIFMPLLIAAICLFVVKEHQKNDKKYQANVQLVVATKKNKDVNATAQNVAINETKMETIIDLISSGDVLSKAVMAVEGADAYSKNQLFNVEVPNIRKQLNVSVNEESTLISYTFTSSTGKMAAKYANEIAKQTQLVERSLWNTQSIEILTKAVEPVSPQKGYSTKNVLILGLVLGEMLAVPLALVIDVRRFG